MTEKDQPAGPLTGLSAVPPQGLSTQALGFKGPFFTS